jgi:formiminoglutamase
MKNITGSTQETYRTLVKDNLTTRLGLSHFYQFNDSPALDSPTNRLIVESSCDEGVARNGGRRGARFAPSAIRAVLGRMHLQNSQHAHVDVFKLEDFNQFFSAYAYKDKENLSTNLLGSQQDPFNSYQHSNSSALEKILKSSLKDNKAKSIVHLGGGHDHVFPFLQALTASSNKHKLLIINIDAHTDTRMDPLFHSGTPFRQFASQTEIPFELIQIGIKSFANPPDNWKWMHPKGQQEFISYETIPELRQKLDLLKTENTTVVLSLDADFLASSAMEAVSAVAYDGGEPSVVIALVDWYKALSQTQKFFGIYEYNPIFDNLSQKGARLLAHLIYRFWQQK